MDSALKSGTTESQKTSPTSFKKDDCEKTLPGEETKVLLLTDLSNGTDNMFLYEELSVYGKIKKVKINSNVFPWSGTVEFHLASDAVNALEDLIKKKREVKLLKEFNDDKYSVS